MLRDARSASHPLVRYETDPDVLLHLLREQLKKQALPVVETLYEWSGFSRKGAWGMITSLGITVYDVYGIISQQTDAISIVHDFFSEEDEVSQMHPRLNPVSLRNVTHVYQRRASCCRYYLLPQGDLCASCPLVSDEERLQRNRQWMRRQLS
jgi:ferric iron reductase protein FhuF